MRRRGTEATLAARVMVHFRTAGWEVYCEVAGVPGMGARRPDLVPVRADRVLIVEAKLQFGWAVLHQAAAWVGWADGVLVATGPGPKKGTETACRAVAALGLGWLVVDAGEVREVVQPPQGLTLPGRRALLLDALRPEQQGSTPGSANGGHWTPTDDARKQLAEVVAASPGIELRRALQVAGVPGDLQDWGTAVLRGVVDRVRIGDRIRSGRSRGALGRMELHPEASTFSGRESGEET